MNAAMWLVTHVDLIVSHRFQSELLIHITPSTTSPESYTGTNGGSLVNIPFQAGQTASFGSTPLNFVGTNAVSS